MRRFIIAFLAIAILAVGGVTVYAESRTIYNESKNYQDGDDFRKFNRVRNTNQDGTSLENGDVVIWDVRSATNTSLDDRWSVTTTTVAANPLVAGVMTETVTMNNYGWLQTYGIHQNVDSDAVVGQGNVVETAATRDQARTAGPTSNAGFGVALEQASDDTTSLDVFIRR